ncbi:MAG: HPr kinase/phosphorylase, partial [Nitrosomonas sp.]|nr:HPr kinase/phosphorylase [Nitrosomonas sp.]
MSQISIAQLFEDKREKLKLSWVSGSEGSNKLLTDDSVLNTDKEAIGYLNFIQPDWIQVLNSDGINYLNRLDTHTLEKKTNQLIQSNMVCIIIADNAEAPKSILALSNDANIPLLSSPYPSSEIIWVIRTYLSSVLAPSCILHGVLLDVLGMG